MNVFVLFALIFAVVAAQSQSTKRVLSVKEQHARAFFSPLRRLGREESLVLSIHIVPLPGAFDQLEEELRRVSDPASKEYGNYWTVEEIKAKIVNPVSSLAVEQFFQSLESSSSFVVEKKSRFGERFYVKGSIADWEGLLETEFWEWQHKEEETLTIRRAWLNYTIPAALVEHASYIPAALDFVPLKKQGVRRNLGNLMGSSPTPKPTQRPTAFSAPSLWPTAPPFNSPTPPPQVASSVMSFDYANNNPISLINSIYSISSNQVSGVPPIGIYATGGSYANPDDVSLFQEFYGQKQMGSRFSARYDYFQGTTERVDKEPYNPASLYNFDGQICIDNPGACLEADMDVQYSTSLAQGAGAMFIYDDTSSYVAMNANMIDALLGMLDSNDVLPQVVSISYAIPEWDVFIDFFILSKSGTCNFQNITCDPNAQFTAMAVQANLAGMTIVSSSGDNGANGNFNNGQCRAANSSTTTPGYFPYYPSTSMYCLAVGATNGPELLPPVPEIAGMSNNAYSIAGIGITTGGGFSQFNNLPSWQASQVKSYFANLQGPNSYPIRGFGMNDMTLLQPGATKISVAGSTFNIGRGFPDISALGQGSAVIGGRMDVISGTSMSAPIIAGVIQLINSARASVGKGPVGWVHPALYAAPTSAFKDVTLGDNKCIAPAASAVQGANCGVGFIAAQGWDPVTGLGTPNVANLISYFTSLPGNSKNIYVNPLTPTALPTMPPVLFYYQSLPPQPPSGYLVLRTFLALDAPSCNPNTSPLLAVTSYALGRCLQFNNKLSVVSSRRFTATTASDGSVTVSGSAYSDHICRAQVKTENLFSAGANTCNNLSPLLPPELKIVFSTDVLAAFLFSTVSVSTTPVVAAKLNDYVAQGWESQSDCLEGNAQPTFALVIPAGNVSTTIGSPLLLNWSCRKNIFQGPLFYPATGVSSTTLPLNFGLLASKQCVLQKTFVPTNGTNFWGMFQSSQCGPSPPPSTSPTSAPTDAPNAAKKISPSSSASASSSNMEILIGVISGVVLLIAAIAIFFFVHMRSLKKRKTKEPKPSTVKKEESEDFSHDHAGHDEEHQHAPRSSLNPIHRLSVEQRNSILRLSTGQSPASTEDISSMELGALPRPSSVQLSSPPFVREQRLSFGVPQPQTAVP